MINQFQPLGEISGVPVRLVYEGQIVDANHPLPIVSLTEQRLSTTVIEGSGNGEIVTVTIGERTIALDTLEGRVNKERVVVELPNKSGRCEFVQIHFTGKTPINTDTVPWVQTNGYGLIHLLEIDGDYLAVRDSKPMGRVIGTIPLVFEAIKDYRTGFEKQYLRFWGATQSPPVVLQDTSYRRYLVIDLLLETPQQQIVYNALAGQLQLTVGWTTRSVIPMLDLEGA